MKDGFDDDAPDRDGDTRTQTASTGLVPLPACERRTPRLEWQSASGVRTQRAVDATLVIGSAPGSDVCLEDPTVSRIHAEIEPRDDGVWIRDTGSRNGTHVDGVRVGSALLHDGARIRVGDSELRLKHDTTPSRVPLWPIDRFGPLLGASTVMRELFVRLDRAARSQATVLVEGETGTGKELVATAIHAASSRGHEPFVIVDCATLAESLLEAELFGHARGAFTGAAAHRAGAIEAADRGTVFLDEIGELPLSLQPKLLRAIESRTVRRLGENHTRAVDVRFVAATHRDLRAMVNDGSFREDLYFRVAVLKVRVPPLRERRSDVPLLAQRFLPRGGALDPALERALVTRPWRGNVRELRNFVERALAFGPEEALAMLEVGEAAGAPEVHPDRGFHEVRAEWLAHFERSYVRALLERHGNNVSAAARAAGLHRAYLYRLAERHGLRESSDPDDRST